MTVALDDDFAIVRSGVQVTVTSTALDGIAGVKLVPLTRPRLVTDGQDAGSAVALMVTTAASPMARVPTVQLTVLPAPTVQAVAAPAPTFTVADTPLSESAR